MNAELTKMIERVLERATDAEDTYMIEICNDAKARLDRGESVEGNLTLMMMLGRIEDFDAEMED